MKNKVIIPLLIAALLLLTKTLFATDKYTEVMQKNIMAAYNAGAIDEWQTLANTFHRIGEAEKTKWEPFYYEAYCYTMMANNEAVATKKDVYLDLALAASKSGATLASGESELVAMEGFVHMLRVTVDPASRGQQYSGMAFQSFNKAVAMNPENPRALSLLAQMEYGVAQFFGSPTKDACATAEKAVEKFETYKSDNLLAPKWGKGMTEGLKEKCK